MSVHEIIEECKSFAKRKLCSFIKREPRENLENNQETCNGYLD
jgi:hypothetical protein